MGRWHGRPDMHEKMFLDIFSGYIPDFYAMGSTYIETSRARNTDYRNSRSAWSSRHSIYGILHWRNHL